MAYDEGLAQRIFEHLEGKEYIWKKMFGGVCFLFKATWDLEYWEIVLL